MSGQILLNLLTGSGKRDKVGGLRSILVPFCNAFDKFHITEA